MSRHWFWLLKCTNDLLLAWKLWHCWCNVQMWNNLAERKRNQKWKKKNEKKKKKKNRCKQLSRGSPDPSLQWNNHNGNIIMIFASIPMRNIQQFMKIHSCKQSSRSTHKNEKEKSRHQLLPFSIEIFFHGIFPQSVFNLGNKSSCKRCPQVPRFEEGPFFNKF